MSQLTFCCRCVTVMSSCMYCKQLTADTMCQSSTRQVGPRTATLQDAAGTVSACPDMSKICPTPSTTVSQSRKFTPCIDMRGPAKNVFVCRLEIVGITRPSSVLIHYLHQSGIETILGKRKQEALRTDAENMLPPVL